MKPNCRHEDLQLYAYGFLEGVEKVLLESHIEDCPDCRAELDRLWVESQIVSFELSLEPGVTESIPAAPSPERPRPRRLPRAFFPVAAAAAALLLLAAGLFTLLSNPAVEPDGLAWTKLPDGSRYRAVEGTALKEGPTLRSVELDEGSMTIEVSESDDPFTIATPHGEVSSDGGRIAVHVGEDGTRVEVLAGEARFEARRPPEVPAPPGVPLDEWRMISDSAPELLAWLMEIAAENDDLRSRLEELLARDDRGPERETPTDPVEAVAQYDWAELSRVLARITPDLRRGRLPRDPRVLKDYLRSLEQLDALAEVLGVEASVARAARDPRTGPKLFVAALSNAWPDAPESELEAVGTEVAQLLTDHAVKEAAAETPAERAALEEDLQRELAKKVEDFEARQGPPQSVEPVTPVKQPDQGSSGTLPEETPVKEPSESTQSPSTNTDVQKVLVAAGVPPSRQRVFRGTESAVVAMAVKAWIRDFGLSNWMAADLERIAWKWLQEYQAKLLRIDSRVVDALTDQLSGRSSDPSVPASKILALRSLLLRIQASAEKRIYALLRNSDLRVPASHDSVPTFFIVSR